jgi:O-acetyl-ADP-ribose deacetylase (regulator of RNase III)
MTTGARGPASHGGSPAALRVEVVEDDITRMEVDAIANAANNHLWMGAGVAGAIKRAGGEEIEREAVARGPIPVGGAVATGAGRLKAKHVIHGAVMGQDLKTDAGLIERTTRRCLEVADDLGCASIALPAFGTGVGGFPLDECARIMAAAIRAHAPRTLRRVVFAVFGDRPAGRSRRRPPSPRPRSPEPLAPQPPALPSPAPAVYAAHERRPGPSIGMRGLSG